MLLLPPLPLPCILIPMCCLVPSPPTSLPPGSLPRYAPAPHCPPAPPTAPIPVIKHPAASTPGCHLFRPQPYAIQSAPGPLRLSPRAAFIKLPLALETPAPSSSTSPSAAWPPLLRPLRAPMLHASLHALLLLWHASLLLWHALLLHGPWVLLLYALMQALLLHAPLLLLHGPWVLLHALPLHALLLPVRTLLLLHALRLHALPHAQLRHTLLHARWLHALLLHALHALLLILGQALWVLHGRRTLPLSLHVAAPLRRTLRQLLRMGRLLHMRWLASRELPGNGGEQV